MKTIVVFVIGLIVVLCLASISMAQVARTYEAIAPGNTVTGFTAEKYAPTTGIMAGKKAIKATFYVKTNAINYTLDGTTPTQSGGTDVGMYAAATTEKEIIGYHDIETFRCIDATAGSASSLRVTYFFDN